MSKENKNKRIAIFGAGIAGLTAAHELSRKGFLVSVYESRGRPGGFFRSSRIPDGNQPSEYSWHGMGPWYHNTFDLLKQIPFDETGSVFDKGLSRPIDFGIFPDLGEAGFYDRGPASIPGMFRLSKWEFTKSSWLMFKTWTANARSHQRYSRINAAAAWRPFLGEGGYRSWRACFGPWIGSDWTNASLHHAGHFFRKQLITKPDHHHPADGNGPSWKHGAGDGWLLLRGPSSDVWFDRWIDYLTGQKVSFFWNTALDHFEFNGTTVTAAKVNPGRTIEADSYILATTPFAAADILRRSPALEQQDELRLFSPLVQDGPHIQVSFRIAFAEPIRFPRARTAVVVADSEYNLTLFAQEQAWNPNEDLGEGIKSLWTGTSCVATVPGRLFGLPVTRCTKEQFIAEVKAQILSCGSLKKLVREANRGRSLEDFNIVKVEVWHEWLFSPDGIQGPEPKWVTTTNTHPYQPNQITPVPNLFLAGAHTVTEADVWSIEGAVESGRKAARAIEPSVTVIKQYNNRVLQAVARIDDFCYRAGAPHVLDIVLMLSALSILVLTCRVIVSWLAP